MTALGLTITEINLNHSKGTSTVLQRGMVVMGTGISLMQELQLAQDTLRGLEGVDFCYTDPKAVKTRA